MVVVIVIHDKIIQVIHPVSLLHLPNNLIKIKVSFLIDSLNNNSLANLQTDSNPLAIIMLHHNKTDKIDLAIHNHSSNSNNNHNQILLPEIVNHKIRSHHLGVLDRIGRNRMKIAIQRRKNNPKKIQVNTGNKKGMRSSKKGLSIQPLSTIHER